MKSKSINKKVIIALSGGVDSSVAAYLLKKKGYNVIALFMKIWHQNDANKECPWKEDSSYAMQVADKLNNPDFKEGDVFGNIIKPLEFNNSIFQSDLKPSDLDHKGPTWERCFDNYGIDDISLDKFLFILNKATDTSKPVHYSQSSHQNYYGKLHR